MRDFIRFFSLFLLTAALLRVPAANGQGGATGAISGTVTDVSGGSVADAQVQISNSATDLLVRRQNTGPDGSFVATLLPPGSYYLVVNKPGFSAARASGVEVRVTETTRVTIALKPGTVSEKVEISAQVATVDTTAATTGGTLGQERFVNFLWPRKITSNCSPSARVLRAN
jgi:hypothetical protein